MFLSLIYHKPPSFLLQDERKRIWQVDWFRCVSHDANIRDEMRNKDEQIQQKQ